MSDLDVFAAGAVTPEGKAWRAHAVEFARALATEQAAHAETRRKLAGYEDAAAAHRAATHCRCCGQFVGNCVCSGGIMTTNGVTTSTHCTPQDHGRDGYA